MNQPTDETRALPSPESYDASVLEALDNPYTSPDAGERLRQTRGASLDPDAPFEDAGWI